MPPKVSVIMPVYNGERYLAEAIASILGHTLADFELIIVDDGSTDRSPEVIQDYTKRDSRIVAVALDENQGKASARNRGIERSSGEYITGMDSDDISLPDRLRCQTAYLDNNPRIGIVGGNIHLVDENLKLIATSNMPIIHPQIVWGTLFSLGMVGSAGMIRRDHLEAVGGYDEGRRFVDDLELWSRLLAQTRFANLTEILLLYRRHDNASGNVNSSRVDSEAASVRRQMLNILWPGIRDETENRIWQARHVEYFSRRAQRRLLRAELEHLIECFVAAGWIEASEIALLQPEIESFIQRIKPLRKRWWKYILQPRLYKDIPEKLSDIVENRF